MKNIRNLMIALVVVIIAASAVAIATLSQENARPPMDEKPTLVTDKLIPLATPEEDFKEVAVVTLELNFDSEKLTVERMSDAYIHRSYAPNMLTMEAPIELTLLGEESISWYLVDPRPEVENERANEQGAEDEPLHMEAEGENTYSWQLVIPLYQDDKPIAASRFSISVDGVQIFEQEIDFDAWRARGQEILKEEQSRTDDQQDEPREG